MKYYKAKYRVKDYPKKEFSVYYKTDGKTWWVRHTEWEDWMEIKYIPAERSMFEVPASEVFIDFI